MELIPVKVTPSVEDAQVYVYYKKNPSNRPVVSVMFDSGSEYNLVIGAGLIRRLNLHRAREFKLDIMISVKGFAWETTVDRCDVCVKRDREYAGFTEWPEQKGVDVLIGLRLMKDLDKYGFVIHPRPELPFPLNLKFLPFGSMTGDLELCIEVDGQKMSCFVDSGYFSLSDALVDPNLPVETLKGKRMTLFYQEKEIIDLSEMSMKNGVTCITWHNKGNRVPVIFMFSISFRRRLFDMGYLFRAL